MKDFQRSAGIDVDGLVGQDTIGALARALAQGHQADPQRTGHSEIPGSLDEIIRIAADSVIARHLWVDRGVAPVGYTKGMALVFARTLCKFKAGDPFALEMARADTGDDDRDVLAHCREQFTDAGMDNTFQDQTLCGISSSS